MRQVGVVGQDRVHGPKFAGQEGQPLANACRVIRKGERDRDERVRAGDVVHDGDGHDRAGRAPAEVSGLGEVFDRQFVQEGVNLGASARVKHGVFAVRGAQA